ncbi:hypothetical protein SAMN04488523_10215 [Sulfitobacter brevis]|uniref:Uncharacterized protein n=1 Tax=Sulfitobacter brevis TaxID=74348 RepID=A0A1I1U830_9RHOB|nr:hypothetical protein [Sulfitobacter brevis]SFD67016.1 hypothetical protein SAMN04488523_10215 [Sulfitobacter brevis]
MHSPPLETASRHARMFELIRQAGQADITKARVQAASRRVEAASTDGFRQAAIQSLRPSASPSLLHQQR